MRKISIIVVVMILILILTGCSYSETCELADSAVILKNESIDDHKIIKPKHIYPIVVEEDTNITEVEEQTDRETEIFCITAYCACEQCCGKTDGITATGTVATEGRTIAVDPSIIPYGTEVIINGHTYIAEDCGGAIDGNRIDIFFDNHQEALNWGVQYLEVEILG